MSRKLAVSVVLSLVIGCSTAWAADVQTGTWKLNIAKSQYKTGGPPQSSTVTITPEGKDGVKVMVNTVNGQGGKLNVEYAAQYDGKEYPRTETGAGALAGQTVALKRIDDHTAERTAYLKGKKLTTEKWEISRDGKTRTVTQTGVSADGKPVDQVQVFDKQ
jgi:hypothetical protein